MNTADITLTLTAANGVAFTARYLPAGTYYAGSSDCEAISPIVEFYDARHPHTLHGGVPAWSIDAATMSKFREWLTSQ